MYCLVIVFFVFYFFFFFNDTATPEIYTRSIVGSVRCVQETGEKEICRIPYRRCAHSLPDSMQARPQVQDRQFFPLPPEAWDYPAWIHVLSTRQALYNQECSRRAPQLQDAH
eukprot:TRINITY_DN27408_c0_g2_i1.p2 TRINITY_DN27408_c0_g2~~TRINITY_DN27408_c0_g2_i1.p2  ORF type:complete len:112 (+),score=19.91 TRINITY_DN27408_c0_g2_i1:73-408(+)